MPDDRDDLRYQIREILVDHLLAVEGRNQQRTETTWPDQSDIYDETDRRLREAFDPHSIEKGIEQAANGETSPVDPEFLALGAADFIDIVFEPMEFAAGEEPDMVFVEVEDSNGASINVGEWIERGDGYWALRIGREG